MFEKLWQGLAAVGALAAAVLYFMYSVADAQKEKAQTKAKHEREKRKRSDMAREQTAAVDQARNEARERGEEIERENRDRRDSGDRPSEFGDRRLRDPGD